MPGRNYGPSLVFSPIMALFWVCMHLPSTHGQEPEIAPVLEVLARQCCDCHHANAKDGAIDLQTFRTLEDFDRSRTLWKTVFDVVESEQMPLAGSGYDLTAVERQQILGFVRTLLSRPDPMLKRVDPGKPILRRLSRLEYNNTVRDLFGIEIDVFMFPERLPVADKRYFTTSQENLGQVVQTSMLEYGQKYDVLLPQHGLPGENRAEYGFSNRGDSLNFSPLLMEKYLELAMEIVASERLLRESRIFQDLLGVTGSVMPVAPKNSEQSGDPLSLSPQFASRDRLGLQNAADADQFSAFVSQLTSAHERGSGGTFDVPNAANNRTISGKGALLKLRVGTRTLTINPNVDLWLAAFSTAQETSGEHLFTNRQKGQKKFELTFGSAETSPPEIIQLGICVLARRNHQGTVRLAAILSNGQAIERTAEITEATGNAFFSWVAPAGERIVKLAIDGSQFSGDHVLLDDLGFVLRDLPSTARQAAPVVAEITPNSAAKARVALEERVSTFMRRAYRHTIEPQEVRSALDFIAAQRLAGDTEQAAIKRWVQSILVSPEFLFRIEPVRANQDAVRPLEPHEIANRLSYFLWASMPDDDLLDAAEKGQLGTADELKAQVQRMLRQRAHSRELAESFAVQWLRLDQLFASQPDRKMFKQFYSGPQGKSTLHGVMMTEALLLFETVLCEDRSAVDLFGPDFTWLNQQLADLYGLNKEFSAALGAADKAGWMPADDAQKIPATYWLRTALTDQNRGGMITMAGPLTLTSLPFRTSPVKRGAWLLETVFNRPPSEPKVAFVLDEIEQNKPSKDTSSLTVRQKFEQHRNNPNCYSCHSRIDPPGFALEMFDAIGVLRKQDGSQAVDATGNWNQRPFDGAAEFKSVLLLRKEELMRGFIEHLMSFALGRKLEHYDMQAVDRIVADAKKHDYRFSTIIEGIVLSYPFLNVRNQR